MEERVNTFLASPSVFLRFDLLKKHPELLDDAALRIIDLRRQQARETARYHDVQSLSEKRLLLTCCREFGIDVTLFGRHSSVDPEIASNIPDSFREDIHRFENTKKSLSARDTIEFLHRILDTIPQKHYPYLWAEIHQKLCVAHLANRSHPPAEKCRRVIECCNRALEEYRYEVIPTEWARIQSYLGVAWKNHPPAPGINVLQNAIGHYSAALTVYCAGVNPLNRAVTQMNLAIAISIEKLGDQAENTEHSIHLFQSALQTFVLSDFPIYRATTHINLAATYKNRQAGDRLSNLNFSIEQLQMALPVFSQQTAPEHWAMIQTNLGNAYLESGILLKSPNEENNHHKSKHSIHQHQTKHSIHRHQMMHPIHHHQIEQAIIHYEQALQVRTRTASPAGWAKVSANLAAACIEQTGGSSRKNSEIAIRYCHDALSVFSIEKTPFEWANTQKNLVLALRNAESGKTSSALDESIRRIMAALDVFSADHYPRERLETLVVLADILMESAQWDKAIPIFHDIRHMDQLLRRQELTQLSENRRVHVTAMVYSRAAYCFARCGMTRQSLEWLESGKMQLFRDRMQQDTIIFNRLQDSDQAQYRRIVNSIRCLTAEQLQAPANIPRNLTDIAADIRVARHELDDLMQRIRQYEPEFLFQGLSLDDMTDGLSGTGQKAFVIFNVTRYGTCVIILSGTPHQPEIHSLLFDNFKYDDLKQSSDQLSMLHADLESFRKRPLPPPDQLAHYCREQTEIYVRWNSRLIALMHELDLALFRDITEHLDRMKVEKVVLVTHKELNILPLHLVNQQTDNSIVYLMDRFEISYLPSFGLIRQHPDHADDACMYRSFIGITDAQSDLTWTGQEVNRVSALFEISRIMKFDSTLQPANFTGANGYDVLHFSCHGSFDSNDPFNSCLVMSIPQPSKLPGAAAVDQTVDKSAWSLLNILRDLHLRHTKLVVLSACESGLIESHRLPDEFIGLPAGFLLAGAGSVLSSLWCVPDESACALMTSFYTNLTVHGLSPAGALQSAQQCLRGNSKYAEPMNWGAFKIVGG